MNNKKIIGPEYKDEYKRKHRSKFLSNDEENNQKFSIFKVTDIFKPEHNEYFKSLYPYDPSIIDQYKLPEDKKESTKITKKIQKKKVQIPKKKEKEDEKVEDNKEDSLGLNEKENEFQTENIDNEKNVEQIIKQKFIKIFDPKLQREEMKELEVELYVKKGSKTDKIMKKITNGEKAVQFFAMYGNTTPTKFIFCEKVDHTNEHIYSPYDLKVVPRDKIGKDYFIVTPTGISHAYPIDEANRREKVPELAAEFYTLSEWMYQSTLFNILRKINYFKQYLSFKLFSMWRNFNRFKKFQSVRKQLSEKLFLSKPAFVEKMIQANSQINKISKVSLQKIVGDTAWTSSGMADFEGTQRKEFENAKGEFKKIIETEILDTLRELYRNISTRLKDVREIDETENSKTLQELKNKSMYNLKIEKRMRRKLIQLASADEKAFDNYVTMTDLMCLEMLYKLNRQNLVDMNKILLSRKNNQAYFTLRLSFGDGNVALTPNRDTIFQKFSELFKGMIDTIIEAPRLISIFSKKNYEQILLIDTQNQNDKNNIDPERLNLKTNDTLDDEIKRAFKFVIEKSKYYSKYTKLIYDKLGADFDFIFEDTKRSFEEFKPLQIEKEQFATADKNVDPNLSIQDVRKKIEDCNIWKTKVMGNIKDNFNPNIMLIDSKLVKDEFNKYLDEFKKIYEDFLGGSYAQLKKEIQQAVDEGNTKLATEHNTIDKICKFIEELNAFQPTMQKLDDNVNKIGNIYTLIKQFNIDTVSQKDLNDYETFLKNSYIDMDKKIKDERNEINSKKDSLKSEISSNIEKNKADIIKENEKIINDQKLFDDKTDRMEIQSLLTNYKNHVEDYKNKMDKSNSYLKTLEYPPSEDIEDEWKKLNENYDLKNQLWTTLIDLEKSTEKWKNLTINQMKNEKIEDAIRDFNISVTSIKSKIADPDKDKVFSYLYDLSNTMNQNAPVIQVLSSTSMQERHWIEFFQIVKPEEVYTPEQLNSTTFGMIISNDKIKEERDKIDNISAAAIAQEKIMKDIDKISGDWANIKFIIQNQSKTKNEVKYIIASVEEIYNALDEHSQLVAGALSSRHVADIRDKVEEWDNMLNSISAIIEEWLLVQKQWIYLENIFSAEDIKKQLPEPSKNFAKVNKLFKELMRKTYADPIVINRCKQEGLLEMLTRFHKELDTIQKSLEDYLQTKRKAFPRFYFLSNDELLKILSNTRQPRLVNDYLSKCFDGIKCVNFVSESSNEIIEMVSPEDEIVPLTHTLFATENIEGWLNELEASMFESVYDKTKLCLEKYPGFKQPRREWIYAGYPCQCVITDDQVMWAEFVEKAIDSISEGGNLSDFLEYMEEIIIELSTLVREKVEPLKKSLVERLIIINVHARAVVSDMIRKGVKNKNDFEWQKNLKFYWEKDINVQTQEERMEIVIKQTNSRFIYGYEYLGNPERMVITPLTDKCYITLTSALHINFGGAPAGPAGTGKTETTKDLSKALAIKVCVFNCTDQLDYKMMGRMFCGLAECGAWACFDEFNRIEIEVLSVIAQQIETIQTHLREKKWIMDFDGKTIKLKPRFGVFITMNPGYAGRTELPDNLKSLFRPVAMMIPDYALVAEVTLYSKGFKTAKDLSVKMHQLFKLSSEQLSKQKHYDFGLRGIKSILTRAGYLKEKFPKDPEAEVLIRAMKDSNLPKFLEVDIELFLDIIKDLFPTTVVNKIDNKIFNNKVKEIIEAENLKPTPGFVEKVGQLLDTMMVRLGNMIVGVTGTGKTSIYQVLVKTLTELGKNKDLAANESWYCKINTDLLNPKAVPKSDLYMAKDEITQTWEDGIVARIMREAEDAEKLPGGTSKRLWLIFDGPVDATWIEDMNTVLDDSRKLCLPDSSNIKIPKMMNLIFEVQDLEVASPATVSRCGMVYMEPHHVGLLPIIKSWVLNYQEKLRKMLEEELEKPSTKNKCEQYIAQVDVIGNELEKYIPRYISLVREKCKEKIPSVDINLAQSCLNIISCFYQPDIIKPEAANINDICNYLMAFAIIWSIGANLEDKSRNPFAKDIKSKFNLLNVNFNDFNIYDVCINITNATFDRFFDKVSDRVPYKYDENFPFFNILIPTNDTVKYKEVMSILSNNGFNSLYMGETGVGKSVVIMDYLKNEKSGRFIYKSSNFSAKTTSRNIYDILKTTIYKNGNFAPPAGKKFIYFIDDINLPQLDLFGAQQPIEFIRQLIDNRMLYDEKKIKRSIKDTIIMAACAPPSGGRNPVTPRLFRHFNMIWITDLSNESMQLIFKTIVSSWLSQTKNLEKETDVLIDSALAMYQKIREKLLPTPSKSHYTFNLRDMSKVIQGMVRAGLSEIPDKKMLVYLWIHEMSRQFRDRLLAEDIPWFDNEIKNLYEGKLAIQKGTLPSLDQLIFTDIKEKCYKISTDPNILLKRINDELESYNTASRAGQMKLVFFTDAINHFCRIARILNLARGNALLIGLGGSGRQSLTKIVVFALKQEMNTLQIAKGYGVEAFLKDIGKILKKSGGISENGGVNDNKKQAFLFSDTQILHESFLEDINNILNNGEVPNLFKDDEMAVIFNNLKDKAKENKYPETKDGVYQYFVATVRDSLHVVLSFSPVGSSFRNRCIQFPSIINCCTIDWFNVWPDDALKSVAGRYLKTIGETIRGQPANTVKPLEGRVITMLSIIFVEIQKKALELSKRFQTELRRNYYITPTSYLEFIKLFIDIYNEKIKIIPEQIKNYKLGIKKLNEANEIVKSLKEELVLLEPQQIQRKKDVDAMIVVLEEKKKVVGEERTKIQGEKDEVDVQRNEILKIKEECDAEMATAKPKLDYAKEALQKLDEGDLKQLRSYSKPSENILALARNICFVFDCKGSEYSDFKILIMDTKKFKDNCQNEAMMVKKLNDPRKLKQLGDLYETIREKDFTKVSLAADGLKIYVGALLDYVKVYRQVKPKMDQQEKATRELQEVEAKLEEKSKTLKAKVDELAQLEKEYNNANRELSNLEFSIKNINIKMKRAGKLVNGLKDEGVRWKEKIIQLSREAKNLLANVIISSTVVSYFGPFTMEYRKEFLSSTKEFLIRAGVHYSTHEDSEEERRREEEEAEEERRKEEEEAKKKEEEEEAKKKAEAGEEEKKEEEPEKTEEELKKEEEEKKKKEEEEAKKKEEEERIKNTYVPLSAEEIEERLLPENIPDFSIQAMLSDPMEIRDWNYSGLPADELSIENAIITVRAKRWPLIIDPQMQANKWIRNYYRKQKINCYKITNKNLFNLLKNSIMNGYPCLIENVEQTLDSSLEPILANQVFKQGAGYYLSMGSDKPIQFTPGFKLFMTSKMANPHYLPELSIKVTLINFTVTRKGLEDQLLVEVVKHERPELEAQKDETMLSINNGKKMISDLEASILNLVNAAGSDILDNDILVDKLEESKIQSAKIKEELEKAEVTAKTINKERTSYHPISVRGSILYFAIASLANIDSMYNYSLEYFLKLFNQRLNRSEASKDVMKRVQILIDDITISFYEKISRGLFEKDKLLYSFLIVSSKLQNDESIGESEWQFFLRGVGNFVPKVDEKESPYYKKGIDSWMSLELYKKIISFKEFVVSFYDIENILGNFNQDDIKKFNDFLKSENPHIEVLPEALEKISQDFNRLLLVKELREEKLIFAIKHFIETSFSKRFLESPPFSVETAFLDSLKTTPLIFILSAGANPVKFLRDYAKLRGVNMINISLGQGQGDIAKRAIFESIKNGNWVCLENCHLARSWMPKFEEILEEVNDKEDEIHEDYRLWLTSMPSNAFPATILQSGVKITNEPPKGIRASLKGTFLNIKDEDFKNSSLPEKLKKMTFGLAFFHAIILERRKFGPLGWNIPYEWMNSDLEASRMHLNMYIEEYASEGVPFEILRFLVGTINYGGRVTDDKDEKLIAAILEKYFDDLIFDENYKFSESGIYYAPDVENMEVINQYIEQLPLDDEPEVFGLNNNANITLQKKTVREFMEPLIGIQPRTSSSGGKKPDEIVLDIKYDIDAQFAEVEDLDKTRANVFSILVNPEADKEEEEKKDEEKKDEDKKEEEKKEEEKKEDEKKDKKKDKKKKKDDGKKKKSPLGNFLLQECDKFNNLLKVMRASLHSLELAVKGTEVMSPQIEKVYHSFLDGLVPKLWADNAYLSLKPLSSWIKDLILRVKFMSKWLYDGPQDSFWISAFFFPQGFNTAVLQTYARKTLEPIDKLTFRTNVLDKKYGDEEIIFPSDGVNIHGLQLEGASWDFSRICLREQLPGQLHIEMPVIWLEPINVSKLKKTGYYECPLYKTSSRAGELSTTGHSTNFVMYFYLKCDDRTPNKNADHWIRRGTALLTQLDI